MADILFSARTPKSIGNIEIDAFVEEDHGRSASVTEYPLEDGTTVADHIKIDADALNIRGMVGPTSLLDVESQTNRVLDTYEALRKLMDDKIPITIVTGLRVYSDMVVTQFSCSRDSSNGQSLPFSLSARQIKIVKSQTIISKSTLGGPDATKKQAQPVVPIGKSTTSAPVSSNFSPSARRTR